MLKGEINQNLEELTEFWKKVKQVDESSRDSPLVLASRFTDLGPPTLIYAVWEKQSQLLTKALSDEQLRRVQSFYHQLVKVTNIHSTLRNLLDEQQSYLKAGPPEGVVWGPAGPPIPFQRNAPALWDDLEQIVLRLIEEGNSLGNKTYRPVT